MAEASSPTNRDLVVQAALDWVGTPYNSHKALKGVGCDCLGLIRGIYSELVKEETEAPPNYSAFWGEMGGREHMLEAANAYLVPYAENDPVPGQVLIFRMHPQACAKHAGILVSPDYFVHAYQSKVGGVIRARFVPFWRNKLAGIFDFPVQGFN